GDRDGTGERVLALVVRVVGEGGHDGVGDVPGVHEADGGALGHRQFQPAVTGACQTGEHALGEVLVQPVGTHDGPSTEQFADLGLQATLLGVGRTVLHAHGGDQDGGAHP